MMSKVRAMLVALATISVIFTGANFAQAQSLPAVTSFGPDYPKTGIFIGNSFFYYNNGLPGHLTLMEKAADPDNKNAYRNTMVTIGGSGFDWHDVENYLRPNAIGKYSFDDNNNVVFNKPGQLFDVAVMMDCSQCPIHPTLKTVFTDFALKNSTIVRAKGAKPAFFMSWAYADKPEMTAQLAEAYTKAGNDNNALVIPAGLAFANSISKQPELNLYAPDKRHPSLAGTYLATCVVFASLTGRSPVGNPYTAGIDAPTAKFLQTVAWDTVQSYYAK
ncbi:MAG: DUF4886 domain-containing protein [Bradyrhizobium sp.]